MANARKGGQKRNRAPNKHRKRMGTGLFSATAAERRGESTGSNPKEILGSKRKESPSRHTQKIAVGEAELGSLECKKEDTDSQTQVDPRKKRAVIGKEVTFARCARAGT